MATIFRHKQMQIAKLREKKSANNNYNIKKIQMFTIKAVMMIINRMLLRVGRCHIIHLCRMWMLMQSRRSIVGSSSAIKSSTQTTQTRVRNQLRMPIKLCYKIVLANNYSHNNSRQQGQMILKKKKSLLKSPTNNNNRVLTSLPSNPQRLSRQHSYLLQRKKLNSSLLKIKKARVKHHQEPPPVEQVPGPVLNNSWLTLKKRRNHKYHNHKLNLLVVPEPHPHPDQGNHSLNHHRRNQQRRIYTKQRRNRKKKSKNHNKIQQLLLVNKKYNNMKSNLHLIKKLINSNSNNYTMMSKRNRSKHLEQQMRIMR